MEDIKEKSADELFEELGYKKRYFKNSIFYEENECQIIIDNDIETIDIVNHYITKTELKAINKKIEELRMELEIWKDIPEYEGLYQASNLGRIKSLKRYKQNHSKLQLVEERIIKQYMNKHNGYMYAVLTKNAKEINHRVHRLIAKTFIPNIDNKKTINHIDGNKTNNNINNLEWATNRENVIHAIKNGLLINTKNIEIAQYDKNENLIATYRSLQEASEKTGFCISGISMCINNKQKTCNKYKFRKLV